MRHTLDRTIRKAAHYSHLERSSCVTHRCRADWDAEGLRNGVRVPIDEKYMWIQADVERDAGVPVGNKTEAGTKGQLEVEYESGKRKVDFEIVVEIWRSGLTRDSGHYIIVKNGKPKGLGKLGKIVKIPNLEEEKRGSQ